MARQGLICGLSLAAVAMGMPAAAQAPQQGDQAQHIADLLARMSVEHKVAQLVEPDIGSITPEDMRRYRFGTILNGGNSGPGGNDKALAPAWLALADAMYRAGTEPLPAGEPVIPPFGARMRCMGTTTSSAPRCFRIMWRWARRMIRRWCGASVPPRQKKLRPPASTGLCPHAGGGEGHALGAFLRGFSEDPDLVTRLGVAEVEGLQGKLGTSAFLDQRHVLASIKHFFADGGTGGVDQGDTRGDMNALIATHAAPYIPAIKAGAQAVMASFSSINGEKMHGNKALLTDLLRGKMGFDGLLVGDWNAHGQVPGCSNGDCPKSLLAGLDVFMVPNDWRALYEPAARGARWHHPHGAAG
jgi:beta-glucosidase